MTVRHRAFNVGLTVLLLLLLAVGAFTLWPTPAGASPRPLAAALLTALLPIATMVLLSLLERCFTPAGPRKTFEGWLLHLQINIFWTFVAGFTYAFAALASGAVATRLGFRTGIIDLRFAQGKGVLAIIGAAWLAAIAGDFFFYWYHRTAHKVHLLWQIHKMHHMDEALDALTIYRDNWLDPIYSAIMIGIPSGLFLNLDDIDPWDLGALSGTVAAVVSAAVVLGHMNVRLQVGRGSLFFCSPQVHRIHHSRLPQHFDKNFAFVFPLWDVLFGTYYAPQKDEFPPTGIPGERDVTTFWEAQTFTLRAWWKLLRARTTSTARARTRLDQ
jgi:sterol desaturase/sphingolipid hydroxylase (fatty acid hydroxylase superfamily)